MNSTHGSLKWTFDRLRLSAETDGHPAEQIVMGCAIGVIDADGRRKTSVQALWDTGTAMTIVSTDIARRLRLQQIDTITLHGLGGESIAPVCKAVILFPNGIAYGPIAVAVQDMPVSQVLLGMDIISIGTFLLERKPDGGTRFTFTLPE